MQELPLVLVVDDEALNRDYACASLSADGWRVATAASGEAALAMLGDVPALILMDLCMDGLSGAEAVAAIRESGGTAAAVPILAFTTTRISDPHYLFARGFDGLVSKPCTPEELRAAAAPWKPDGACATMRRLGAVFGDDRVRDMTLRLRALLADGVAALDCGDASGVAHRIAGSAGMLGFGRTGQAWLAYSEGDIAAAGDARLLSRRAIAEIDRL